jgi:hypothetical protein
MLKEIQTLLDRLAEADGVWQREKARARAWRIVPAFLGLAAAAFAADAFLQLGPRVRIACLAAASLFAASATAWVWWTGWRQRNPPERIARHLEQRDPALGSRLINALQLAHQAEDGSVSSLTRQLAAQAARQYSDGMAAMGLTRLALTGEATRRRRVAAWGIGLFVALLAAFFPVTSMVLPRFLDPLGDHPPYAFTRLELVNPGPDGVEVVYGARLTIKARWSGHEPRELFLTLQPAGRTNGAITLPMIRDGQNGFAQEIPDVHEDLLVVAHSRTRSFFSRQHTARVLLTPRIEKAFLNITPPQYTGLKPEERPFPFAAASALSGSELRFRLRSNRPLREGSIEVIHPDDRREQIPLRASASNEVTGSLVLSQPARIRFRVIDVAGLPSEPTAESLLSPTHDLPPTVQLTDPAQDGIVAEDYDLRIRAEAHDDYGVRTLRLHQGLNGAYPEPRTFPIDGIQRDASISHPVSIRDSGATPGDRLSFFVEAIDTAPEPHLARSQTVTLLVVSTSDYNDFLREERDVRDLAAKYEEVLHKFNELREEQVRLAEAAAAQAKKAAAGDTNALRPDQLDRLMAAQNELNQRLEQQARAMESLVRPTPLYDFETELQQQLNQEAAQIRQSTATNSAALNRIASDSTRPDGKRSVEPAQLAQLEKEAREQAERLGAQEKSLAESIEKPLEDLAQLHDLMNAFNTFQQLHEAQQELASQVAAYEKRGSKLSREDQLALKDLAARQEGIREVLDQLPDQLRQKAAQAEKTFPKAAQSGRDLAEAIEDARMSGIASSASQRMLDGEGERSAQMARRLEEEMSKLIAKCDGQCPGQPGNELDEYLRLSSGKSPGKSLSQMQQCRKMSLASGMIPKKGRGKGQGQGDGYSQNSSPQMSVLGNEKLAQRGPKESASKPGTGAASGPGSAGIALPGEALQGDVLKGLNPLDRQSAAIPSEGSVEAYRPVVDEYFKAITRPK